MAMGLITFTSMTYESRLDYKVKRIILTKED